MTTRRLEIIIPLTSSKHLGYTLSLSWKFSHGKQNANRSTETTLGCKALDCKHKCASLGNTCTGNGVAWVVKKTFVFGNQEVAFPW